MNSSIKLILINKPCQQRMTLKTNFDLAQTYFQEVLFLYFITLYFLQTDKPISLQFG